VGGVSVIFSFLFYSPALVKNIRFVGGKIHHGECSKTAPANVDKTTNVTALQTLRLCCCSCCYARQQQTYPRLILFPRRKFSEFRVCSSVLGYENEGGGQAAISHNRRSRQL
jgi:hypothetical protein